MLNSSFSWTPISQHLGALVDLDIAQEISPEVEAELVKLYDEQHLLLFRGREIDYPAQRKLVSILGNLLPEKGDAKYVSTLHDVEGNKVAEARDPDARVEMFHSDLIFTPTMSIRGISLYAENVPSDQGPVEGTNFLSARQAYRELPANVVAELEGRTAIYIHALGLTPKEQMALRERPFDEIRDQIDFWAEHSILYTLPRSGDPTLLYVPWFMHSIVGMSPQESQRYFDIFDGLLYQEDKIYTHAWQQNDLLVWDNIALQHARETKPDAIGPVGIRVLRRAVMGTEAANIYSAGYSFEAERSRRVEAVN